MASYVVTGGCGFIGQYLVDALIEQGNDVCIIDDLSSGTTKGLNPKAQLLVADICDEDTIKSAMLNSDGCFHLAAVADVQATIEHWVISHESNVTGTIVLLNIAKEINQTRRFPFVYASSAAVYGESEQQVLSEESSTQPISPYGVDKLTMEMHAKIASEVHHVPTVGLRLFNVYGKKAEISNAADVISVFIEKISHDQDLTIYGNGQQQRDFIYVEDVVQYFIKAMEIADVQHRVINICNSQATSIAELAEEIAFHMQKESHVHYQNARVGDIEVSIGDNKLAQKHLPISEHTSLDQGLRKIIKLYQKTLP